MRSEVPKSRLIVAMMKPNFYPDRPPHVELRQTHMSWIFLAGEYVYKVKKPVRFDFADCSMLGVRYGLCREELLLNRRLAPDIYLGVAPIIRDGLRFILGEETDSFDPLACEFAVKMRRLPKDRMFDRLIREGQVSLSHIEEIAKRLASLHKDASTSAGWRHGSATAIRRLVLGNLDECSPFSGNTITFEQSRAIGDYFDGFIAAHRALLDDRVRKGRVRDGHGDLRCEHICLMSGIQIFDCLEFSESLRCVDVASDIAFLAMGLDSLGVPALADRLVSSYVNEASDQTLRSLTNFYQCHRACVRGKVETLKSLAEEVPQYERDLERASAIAHFSLAASYAARGRPAILIVCGLSGSGKSTVARLLQGRTGFELLDSDRTRKRLAGVPEFFDGGASYGSGLYSPAFDRLTYDSLFAEAERHLRDGRGVIIDATFKAREDRRAAITLGYRTELPVLFVECRADQEEVSRRLRERTLRGGDPSDATEDVYVRQRSEFMPLDDLPAPQHLVVDTTQGVEDVISSIESRLRQAT
jgi:uncharacterized protein